MRPMTQLRKRLGDAAATALWWSGVTHPARWGKDRLPVVTFHRVLPADAVADSPYPSIAVTPEELAWFLNCFSQYFRCVSLGEAVAAQRAREPANLPWMAVSFDDGTLDNFEYAAPVLQEAGVTATFFVVAQSARSGHLLWPDRVVYGLRALLGQDDGSARAERLALAHGIDRPVAGDARQQAHDLVASLKKIPSDRVDAFADALDEETGRVELAGWEGMMTFDQIRSLREAGHEIGSHSLSHPILTNCDDHRLQKECEESRRLLEEELGVKVGAFCYPNGDHDARVVRAVQKAGFTHAVTTDWGTNSVDADPWTLKRSDIQSHTTRSRSGLLSTPRLAWRLSGLHLGV